MFRCHMILLNLHNFKTPKNRLDLKLSDSFHIHPARWVIERGGVAFLMFVDSMLCIVVLRFSMDFMIFLSRVRLISMGVIVFSAHGPLNFDVLSPENYSFFGGSLHKVTVGPLFWHMKAAFFSAELVASVWSHLCQGFASKRHEEISVFQGFPAPLPGLDICLDCSVELSLVFGTARSWKLIEKITT